MATQADRQFVSRAGLKLEHALREFELDVAGFICADFGCNVGGFTDCLLQHGATRVYAIDTGYGTLAWKLRSDDRVIVMERTNALHALPPSPPGRGAGGEGESVRAKEKKNPHPNPIPEGEGFEGVDLVTIDLAWTPQRLAIPAALRWLKPASAGGEGGSDAGNGRIITLIKPHYELSEDEKRQLLHDGRLAEDEAERIFQRVIDAMPDLGAQVIATTCSPLTGGKSTRKGKGNIEYLALLTAAH